MAAPATTTQLPAVMAAMAGPAVTAARLAMAALAGPEGLAPRVRPVPTPAAWVFRVVMGRLEAPAVPVVPAARVARRWATVVRAASAALPVTGVVVAMGPPGRQGLERGVRVVTAGPPVTVAPAAKGVPAAMVARRARARWASMGLAAPVAKAVQPAVRARVATVRAG